MRKIAGTQNIDKVIILIYYKRFKCTFVTNTVFLHTTYTVAYLRDTHLCI